MAGRRQTRMGRKRSNNVLRARRTTRKTAADRKSLSRPEKREVLRLVRTQGETKSTAFYQSFNDGTTTARATGIYGNRGWAIQNSTITGNNTDILQLIPFVAQGTDDMNRIGQRIQPVSLTVKGSLRIKLAQITNSYVPADINVYIFVLQHVSMKDYTTLYNNNDFTQLLDVGDTTIGTVAWKGDPQNPGMPVTKQYYRVLQRKVVKLRYAGANLYGVPPPPIQPMGVSIANSHTHYADFSLNLTKHIPKTLMYPESGPLIPALVGNTPTNSSLFMAMGYVDWTNPSDTNNNVTTSVLEQTYVSQLKFKDM